MKGSSNLEKRLVKGNRDLLVKDEKRPIRLLETFNRKDVVMGKVLGDSLHKVQGLASKSKVRSSRGTDQGNSKTKMMLDKERAQSKASNSESLMFKINKNK
jgi:hypothetical protein